MKEAGIKTRFEPGDGLQLDTLVAGIAVDSTAVSSAQVDRAIEEAQARFRLPADGRGWPDRSVVQHR
jgi:hypothetical protein